MGQAHLMFLLLVDRIELIAYQYRHPTPLLPRNPRLRLATLAWYLQRRDLNHRRQVLRISRPASLDQRCHLKGLPMVHHQQEVWQIHHQK